MERPTPRDHDGRDLIATRSGTPSGRTATLALLVLSSACGVLQPPQDPDELLPTKTLNPSVLVTQQHTAALPDSVSVTSGPTYMRFTVTGSGQSALAGGAALEAVLRMPAGAVRVEAWNEGAGAWENVVNRTAVGTGDVDVWWRDGWADPAAAAAYAAFDGTVRLRAYPSADTAASVVRVVSTAPGLAFIARPHSAMTPSASNLALQSGNILYLHTESGAPNGQLASPSPPPGIARAGSWYWGITDTNVRRLTTGGLWETRALLPNWGGHGGVSITGGSGDLFAIRYAGPGAGSAFAVLYRLADDNLDLTASWTQALQDSVILRRNGMPGGTGSGLGYWPDERVLAAPGLNDGEYGLLTFSLAGRFLEHIPLPFEPATGVKFAFLGDYLFVGDARPTLAALAWNHAHQPQPPRGDLVYRWPAP